MKINQKKRVVTVQKADGTVSAVGQVRKRILGLSYWSGLIEFDSLYEAAKWVEANPDDLNL